MTRRRISAKERLAIFTRAEGKCHICGHKIDAGLERWDVEHVIPLAMGGTEDKGDENLQPAHYTCHQFKTAQDSGQIAKAKRMDQRRMGIGRQSSNPLPGGRNDRRKRKLDGTVVDRFTGEPI